MADIVTGTVTGQLDTSDLVRDHADIRREQEAIGSNIRREQAKEASDLTDVVKTSAWMNSDRTGTEADRVVAQETAYFIAQQNINFSNATALAALKASTDAQFSATQANIQLAAKDNATATALAAASTQMMVAQEASKGRELAEKNVIDDLRQRLDHEYRRAHGFEAGYYNSQSNQVNSAIQALNSQLTETRQGLVNFGTMTGSAGTQSSTSNSVR
jgi:hypothetical protein